MNWKNTLKRNWKSFSLSFIVLCVSYSAMPQNNGGEYPKAIILGGDTVMSFTIEQTKELAKRNEYLKKISLDLRDCDSIVVLKNELISNRESKIMDLENVLSNKDSIISNHDKIHALNDEKIADLKHEIKRHKRHKIIAASIIGALTVGIILK